MKFAYALTAALLAASAMPADAALVINISQVGNNLVSTGAGSVNTAGLTIFSTSSYSTIVRGSGGAVFVGPQADTTAYANAFTNSASFGTGNDVYSSIGTGDTFGLYGNLGYLMLPIGYVSNAALAGTHTYENQTFASAGINTGTYVLNLRNGDTITVNIGVNATPAVPEPATWAMMMLGFGGMGFAMRRKNKVAARIRFA